MFSVIKQLRKGKIVSLHAALLALVLLLGVLVRVGQFPHLPPGLNQDEAASAYEAYALAETGHDKWGNALPAYFPAWGSGQNVLLAYLTAPVVKVFGLSIFTARIVMLLLGVGTLPLLYYCLRPLGRYPALLGTLLLAVAPWHFMLSHWALESNLVPFFMLLGCTLLAQGLITGRRRWIVPALVPFALSLYAYGTTVVVLPVLFGLVFVLCFRQVAVRRRSWLLALGLFLVVAAPFLLFFTENYVAKRNFAWTDSLFFATPLLPATRMSQVAGASWATTVAHNWQFLLAGCDDGTSYGSLPGFKPLLSFTLPLALLAVLIGAWKLARRRGRFARSPQNIVLLIFAAWGLASFGLFFSFELNANRFNHFYLPCIVLVVWAVARIINSFEASVPRPALRVGAAAWLLLEGGLALQAYYGDYRRGPVKDQFNAGLEEAFAAANGLWGIGQVRITDQMALPYVYTLFYSRYPPAQFQREVHYEVKDGTYQVSRFGKYVFVPQELAAGQSYGYLSRKNEFPDTDQQRREVLFTNDAWEVGIMKVTPPAK